MVITQYIRLEIPRTFCPEISILIFFLKVRIKCSSTHLWISAFTFFSRITFSILFVINPLNYWNYSSNSFKKFDGDSSKNVSGHSYRNSPCISARCSSNIHPGISAAFSFQIILWQFLQKFAKHFLQKFLQFFFPEIHQLLRPYFFVSCSRRLLWRFFQ